ncbi:(d)CMP kinase [Methylotuvimicrobium buryatense]|uniref:Cytidylate kinase n=1 Tax=Methylotuvimicrobium buryatense TaxID=95641 RepID=A0A4V1IK12_METBY|nr:(d)CMP kinase [Methylotuvimicrobium buryatense]QCW83295.1 (d)CMP kinase [Methylotuvimicrobium buryatense]
MSVPVLTIDGPSGAGKGTVSRAIARKLGWHYLDSGSIYRSLAIAAIAAGADLSDEAVVAEVAKAMVLEFESADELTVKLDGKDITGQLGLESTGNAASVVAALPEVRKVLLQKQKDFKKPPGLVADGRDMGTVVFPDAQNKVFLTASAEERAMRRYKQLKEKGIDANLSLITQEIEERDRRDQQRKAAPLMQANDAVFIDSSDMSIETVIEQIVNLIR